MAKFFEPLDSNEIDLALNAASPGDEIILPVGIHYLDRIYKLKGVKVRGAGAHPSDVVLRPLKARLFRDQGGSAFENFSSEGGTTIIEGEGHGTTIRNFISWRANIPVKLSGDNHLLEDSAIFYANRTGVEVNGGFYLIPELSDTPFRLKKEIGLLEGQEPSQNWTAEQKKRFEDLYFHRDMNVTIRNVLGYKCGYGGGMMYGGFIKAVPCAGGITLEGNIGVSNLNDYWNDFPSDTLFTVKDNYSFNTVRNAIFLEGYVGETAKANIINNKVVGAHTALFLSAFPEGYTDGNFLAFRNKGKVVHGKTGNRVNKNVGSMLIPGGEPDTIVSLDDRTYHAHAISHVSADYDFDRDSYLSVDNLTLGAFSVESVNNVHEPRESINVETFSIEDLPNVDHIYMNDSVKSDMYRSLRGVEDTDMPDVPVPDPDPVPSPVKSLSNEDIEKIATETIKMIKKLRLT